MTDTTDKLTAAIFSLLMVVSALALGLTGAVAMPSDGEYQDVSAGTLDSTIEGATGQLANAQQSAEIEDDLLSDATDEPVVAVVRLDAIDRTQLTGDREAVVSQLRSHAQRSQEPVLDAAGNLDSVEVLNTLWLANAVVVEADAGGLQALADVPGVDRIHKNFRLTVPEGTESSGGEVSPDQDHTYGLEMINAPQVWDEFDTQGEGADVAILDSGYDNSHTDLPQIDPDDQWQEFDNPSGDPVSSDPNFCSDHGTHVSGTAVGSDDPEEVSSAFGVAPEATLYHGFVLTESGPFGCGGSIAQIVAGMQHSITEWDADIIGMSLGAGGYFPDMIEPSENARSAGAIVTASIGNAGAGESGSPGNVFSNFASGAVDENENVASFSGGEEIDTDSAWGPAAPDYWPDNYIVPDAAAPGVNVLSAVPGDSSGLKSGTSMSQPHKAGAFALLVSLAGDDFDRQNLINVVEETAYMPDQAPSDDPNTRYGHGIIDVLAAAEELDLGPDIPEFDVGDVNEDGERSIVDVVLTQQHLAGVNVSINENLADVDRSGDVSIVDVVLLQQFLAGLADDANADVSNLTAPAEGEPGDEITVSADVENTGSIGTVQGIEFRLAGATVATNRADLSPAGTANSSLVSEYQVTVPDVPGGDYTHGVFSDDDNETATITVLNDFFDVTSLDAPTEVARGNQITVNATIENTGNQQATQDVEFRFADLETPLLTEENVTLDAGESTTVTFEPTVDAERGTYTHGVFTENANATANITVVEPSFLVNDVSGPTNLTQGDSYTVNATVVNNGTAPDEQTVEYTLGAPTTDVAVIGNDPATLDSDGASVDSNLVRGDSGDPITANDDVTDIVAELQGSLSDDLFNVESVFVQDLEDDPSLVSNYDVLVVNDLGDGLDSAGAYVPPDLDLEDEWKTQLSDDQGVLYLDSGSIDEGNAAQAFALDNTGAGAGYIDPSGPFAPPNPDVVEAQNPTADQDLDGFVQEDHPIFTGIGSPGDQFTIANDQSFMLWMDTFDGTVLAEGSLANVGGQEPIIGETTRDGPTELFHTVGGVNPSFDDLSGFTADGLALLSNSVEYLSPVSVGASSSGIGAASTDNTTVQLDPGESADLTFSTSVPANFEPGTSVHNVQTEDDTGTQSVDITATDQIDITDLRAPATAQQYEQITVEADLEHVGTEQTTQQVNFSFAGSVLLSQDVTLSPGDTTTVSFEPRIPQNLAPGTYEHGVTVKYDEAFASIEITEAEPAFMDVSGFDGPITAEQGETINVSATIENTGEKPGGYLGEYVFDGEAVDDTASEGVAPPLDVVVVDTHDPDEDPSDPPATSKYYAPVLADVIDEQTSSDLIGSVDALNVEQDDLIAAMDDYDVFVVQRFNSDTLASDFLDNLGDDQAAVYITGEEGGTAEAYGDSVQQLVDQRGNPASFDGIEHDEMEITEDHPIFDGVGSVGDVVPMATGGSSFTGGISFSGYSGTALAEDTGFSPEPVIAVSDDNSEILSGVNGWGFFADEGSDWSDESNVTLGNMVSHVGDAIAADSDTLLPGESVDVSFQYTVPDNQQSGETTHGVRTADAEDTDTVRIVRTAADMKVTGQNILTESPYFVNDTLETRATVLNDGDATGSLDVRLFLGGTPVNTTTVELGPGEVTTVDLSTTLPEAGEFVVSVNGVGPTQISVGAVGNVEGSVTASGDTASPDSGHETPGAGDPIEGASVVAFPFDPDRTGDGVEVATTDANGSFTAMDVPAGTHGVEIRADSFETFAGTITVNDSETLDIGEVPLDYAESGTVRGEITLDPTDPTADVNVTIDVVETADETTVTLSGGENTTAYTISGVDVNVDDGYTVTATANNYNDATAENVTVDVGADENVDLTLARETGNVTGTVEASGDTERASSSVVGPGDPIENATLSVYPFDPAGSTTPITIEDATDANGAFTVPNLPVGDHGVEITGEGYATAGPLPVTVTADNTTDVGTVPVDYADTGSIEGTVSLDVPAGAGGVDVAISVLEANQGAFITIPEGDTSRTYSVGALDVNVSGGYTVVAGTDNGITDVNQGVEVEPNEATTGVDFALTSEVQGTELSFDSQALGVDDDGNAVVQVDEIQQGQIVSPELTEPSEDFVVLFEDSVSQDTIVDVARIEDAENGELVLDADGATPGTHIVQIHEDLRAETSPGNSEVDVDASDNPQITNTNEPTADSVSNQESYILLMDEQPDLSATADTQTAISQMQSTATASQAPVVDSLNTMGVTVDSQHWVVNAVTVTVDSTDVSRADLASISGVDGVYRNAEYQVPGPAGDEAAGADGVGSSSNHGYTYGLQQIDVPNFVDTYGTNGSGSNVAILDFGLDPAHPDIDVAQGVLAQNGQVTGNASDLISRGGHGEHVAGTATGAVNPAGPVPRYGVASEADLLYADVEAGGGAFTADILAAIEWSVTNNADVASMSLGFPVVDGLSPVQLPMEQAMQNADDAGTLVIGSAGNEGSGAAGGPATSPGSEFSGFSIGASNDQRDIAGFSSGTVVTPNTAAVFDSEFNFAAYPDTYPREFIKPDVSAPGVSVLSAQPGQSYGLLSGTSMAAPHVAGAVGLIQAATSTEHSPEAIRNALAETAEKPAGAPPTNERDIRYGAGIINVTAATMALQDTTTLSGEVTDADTGDRLTGAKITTDTNVVAATENGDYTTAVTSDAATVEVTVDEFGYTAETKTVDNDGVATASFSLSPEVAVDPVAGQPVWTEYDSNFSIVADVRNVEEYTVELVNASGVSEGDLNVSIAGTSVNFGQTASLPDVSADGVPVTVEVDGDFSEADEFELEHTFGGPGDDVVVTTGPTKLTETTDPAAFELSGFTAPDGQELGQAEPYAAQVTITNTGQTAGQAEAQWFLGPLGVAGGPDVVELGPGESQDVVYDFGEIDLGAIFGGVPVGLLQGFEASPLGADATGDVTTDTFDVGSGAVVLFDPFGAARTGEESTVYDATVELDDQNYEDPTNEVVVNTTNVVPNDDYVVVIHETSNGAPGQIIGSSGDLSGAQDNVTVTLDQELNETGEYVAMLHFASSDGPFGAPITRYTAGSVIPVLDTAEIAVSTAAEGPLTIDVEPAESDQANNFTYAYNASSVADPTDVQTILVDFNETSGVDVTTISEDDVSIVGEDTGTPSVDATAQEGPGVLRVTLGDTFTLNAENGFLNVSINGVGVDGGTHDGGIAFLDDGDSEIAVGTDSYDITQIQPPTFEVSNLSAPAEAAENESITVNATVTNTGDRQGTQDVTFLLDGDGDFDSPAVSVVAAENLTLAGGASQEVQLTVNAPDTVGVFEHGLFTADDNQTATLTVGNPQVVASLSDESGAVGENVTVEFNISSFDNTQREVGSYDLNMTFDPSVIEFVDASTDLGGLLTVNDGNADQGQVKLSYADSDSTSTPLTAATITFNVTADAESDIAIVEADSEVNNENANTLSTIFDGGSVSSSTASTVARTVLAPPAA